MTPQGNTPTNKQITCYNLSLEQNLTVLTGPQMAS